MSGWNISVDGNTITFSDCNVLSVTLQTSSGVVEVKLPLEAPCNSLECHFSKLNQLKLYAKKCDIEIPEGSEKTEIIRLLTKSRSVYADFMNDHYSETPTGKKWFRLSDAKKKRILDKQMEEYAKGYSK